MVKLAQCIFAALAVPGLSLEHDVSPPASWGARRRFLPVVPGGPGEGPGRSPWDVVDPSFVGLSKLDLDRAKDYINDNVLDRQCFLLIKDGKIAYEWYNPQAPDPPLTPPWHGAPQDKPHKGWSMTKTVGGFLVLLAATRDGLDIDADITQKYSIPSPKPYPVTLRMMMAQVTGGDNRPGELWRYDEMGNMWLHLFPKIIKSATGHNASFYMELLHTELGLSDSFTWHEVDTKWFRGARGSCRDWARLGQLILNGGRWSGKPLIAPNLIADMQQPVKYAPYNSYSNPCYGLLLWVNANKSKHPGCCWEASRLPNPKCNDETFMDGAVHDLTLNIGLYGQIVMTLDSVKTVVVGFGRDLRPIEPARIGYYPGVCKALGIPCNKPPPIPETKCGETLQCTGVGAQCFSGGGWSHKEPLPGNLQCLRCFQNRLPRYETHFPETHAMLKENCPHSHNASFEFMRCFCGLTGHNANPWAPWPSTTTTTPPPSPAPPLPPPGPTPAPPPAGSPCFLTQNCINGLEKPRGCKTIVHNGGHSCYAGLRVHQKSLMANYGCPQFFDDASPIYESKAFCWCGLDSSLASDYVNVSLPYAADDKKDDKFDDKDGDFLVFDESTSVNETDDDQGNDAASKLLTGTSRTPVSACHNRDDINRLRFNGKESVQKAQEACGKSCYGPEGQPCPILQGAQCMREKLKENIRGRDWGRLSQNCAYCFGQQMHCADTFCLEECACDAESKVCKDCNEKHCKDQFHTCSGLVPHSATFALATGSQNTAQPSTNEEVAYPLLV